MGKPILYINREHRAARKELLKLMLFVKKSKRINKGDITRFLEGIDVHLANVDDVLYQEEKYDSCCSECGIITNDLYDNDFFEKTICLDCKNKFI